MSGIAAIGPSEAIAGYGLAGAELHPAATEADVRAGWEGLGPDVGLLLLTPASATLLATDLAEAPELLWVAIPA